jgi:hypothetical protein
MNENLTVYLTDHLAGSRFAIDMLERLRDKVDDKLFAARLTQLLEQIMEDRHVLESLVERINGRHHPVKEAGAWIAEKFSRWKLSADDPDDLGRFEILEALSLGVLGKMKLWQALSLIACNQPELRGPDYDYLASRAQAQHDQLETFRREAAEAALLEPQRQAQRV